MRIFCSFLGLFDTNFDVLFLYFIKIKSRVKVSFYYLKKKYTPCFGTGFQFGAIFFLNPA